MGLSPLPVILSEAKDLVPGPGGCSNQPRSSPRDKIPLIIEQMYWYTPSAARKNAAENGETAPEIINAVKAETRYTM